MKVFGIAGYSGSGKTTLLEQLIPRLTARGLSVSVIKHAHHGFDVDHPGKDSWRHRQAGAGEVLIGSAARWALLHELRGEPEPTLDDQLARLSPCDLVLVEGYKRDPIPKLEVLRVASGQPPLHREDANIVAIAADQRLETTLPQFAIDDYDAIRDFILSYTGLAAGAGTKSEP